MKTNTIKKLDEMTENLYLTQLFHATFQHLSYPKFKKKNSQTSIETQQELKIKSHELKKKKNTRFSLGFILILRYRFHQNNYFLLQQHWFQGLQIVLPS